VTQTPLKRGMATFAFFFVTLCIFFNTDQNNWFNLYRLIKSGISTQATVFAIYPDDHRACDFEYTVGGHRYSHQEPCNLSIGAVSPLTYLPANPAVSIVRSPREDLNASIFIPLLASMAFGIFAAAGARFEHPTVHTD
jgi:hypothetical protein